MNKRNGSIGIALIFVVYVCLVACVVSSYLVPGNSIETDSARATTETATKTTKTTTKSSGYSKSGSYKKETVKCSNCNGTGKVRYYYGNSALEAALDGHNDYEYGPCGSCDGTGYTYVMTSNDSESSSNMKTCPSCGKKVESLSTRKDAAGVNRTWCSGCWSDYNSIMGN